MDLLESVKNGGDVMIPVREGAIDEAHIIGEIGQLLNGEITGREDDTRVTLYSAGITAHLFTARHVYEKALNSV